MCALELLWVRAKMEAVVWIQGDDRDQLLGWKHSGAQHVWDPTPDSPPQK